MRYEWGIDEVIGYLYSVSFISPIDLGDELAVFERRLTDALREANPADSYHEDITFRLYIAYTA